MTSGLFGVDYACQLMDPPWLERGAGKVKRGANRWYDLMDVVDIRRTILDSGQWRPAFDAHLWMWVTDNFLEDGLWLTKQLGFRYVRTFVWVKLRDEVPRSNLPTAIDVARDALQIGLGQYARGSHELLLFAVRGHIPVPPPERRHPSVFFSERGRHSAKPAVSYEVIESVSPGPRVEFFARSARKGWTPWGNESPETTR